MAKFLFLASFALLLTSCGNGNDNPTATAYGYNAYGPRQNGICPPRVAMDWNNLVAAPCNAPDDYSGTCSRGVQTFLMRDQAYLQGMGCTLVVNQVQWCPGEMQGQQTFQVNVSVLQSILAQRGAQGGGFRPR